MTTDINVARSLRDEGIGRTEAAHDRQVIAMTREFIDLLLSDTTCSYSLDDCGTKDGGPWRGSVPLRLSRRKLIVRTGFATSAREQRHAGMIALWQARDIEGLRRLQQELVGQLAKMPVNTDTPKVQMDLFADEGAKNNRSPAA